MFVEDWEYGNGKYDGMLGALRCKAISDGKWIEAKIIDFTCWEDGCRFTAKGGGEWFFFLIVDIGVWAFITREAAEARLKRGIR